MFSEYCSLINDFTNSISSIVHIEDDRALQIGQIKKLNTFYKKIFLHEALFNWFKIAEIRCVQYIVCSYIYNLI
jgi:hypothetical protein